MSAPLRIAVLASGRGSNLQALLDAARAGRFAAEWAGVFSDRPSAPALQRARAAGVRAWSAAPAGYPSRAAFDDALFAAIGEVQPQLIVMAGYMRIVSNEQVRRWRGRMINIHPSLLPKYPGLRTHARALDAGEGAHGATVHFVTEELDGGPPIAQATVPVHAGDTPEALARRVLAREHPLLVATVAEFAAGRIALTEAGVAHAGELLASPLQLGPDDRLHPAR
jgi:phosphoribosylglycinamide formyltransferase-1